MILLWFVAQISAKRFEASLSLISPAISGFLEDGERVNVAGQQPSFLNEIMGSLFLDHPKDTHRFDLVHGDWVLGVSLAL